jgi:hypothetical protein
MTPKREEAAPPRRPGRPKKAGYQEEKARGAQPVTIRLPAIYLKILESEAKLFGMKRGRFLEMLLKRKLGMLPVERPAMAPAYETTDKELAESKPWLWYLEPAFKKLLDEDRFQMGNLAISSWAIFMLNDWIGRPGGLRSKPRT